MVTAEKAIVIYTMGNTDSLHSHQRLLLCAADYTGLPVSIFRRIQAEGEKPQLAGGPELHFSVSHSGEHWVCAFGPQPLGLDLQQHRPCRAQALARRFFHPQELAWLQERDFSEEAFYHIWTAKESWVKQSGRGIGKGFSDFSVLDPKTAPGCKHIPFLPGYTLCLCSSHIDQVLFRHPKENKGGLSL